MIKTLFFDLGNVLVFFSHARMWEQIAACTGIELSLLKKIFLEDELLKRYEAGQCTTAQVYEKMRSFATRPFSLEALKHAACDIFNPNYEIWPIVQAIKSQGIRLVLLSNTSECHYDHIQSTYPLLDWFDHKILSYKVGACKPEPLIFEQALLHANCDPSECFYTDDIPDFIDSAQKVGLPGAVFTDVPSLRKHLAARHLFV